MYRTDQQVDNGEPVIERIRDAKFIYYTGDWQQNQAVNIYFQQQSENPKLYKLKYMSRLEDEAKSLISRLHEREIGKGGRGIKNGLSISKRKTGRKSIKKINKKRKSNRTFRKRSK